MWRDSVSVACSAYKYRELDIALGPSALSFFFALTPVANFTALLNLACLTCVLTSLGQLRYVALTHLFLIETPYLIYTFFKFTLTSSETQLGRKTRNGYIDTHGSRKFNYEWLEFRHGNGYKYDINKWNKFLVSTHLFLYLTTKFVGLIGQHVFAMSIGLFVRTYLISSCYRLTGPVAQSV